MRAIIYLRVSTDAQEREGTSLDTQGRESIEYAEAAGWTVTRIIRDVASGASLDRPGLEQVRRAMRDGSCDVVLAHAVDRLSRNQNHIGVLLDEAEEAGVRLDFVTEEFEQTLVGQFILAARAFVAATEREKTVERTVRGKKERARSGRLPQATGKPESTDRSLTGRDAGLAESSAGVPAFARRRRGRSGARSPRSAPLGGAERGREGARGVRGHAGASLGPGASAVGGASGGER